MKTRNIVGFVAIVVAVAVAVAVIVLATDLFGEEEEGNRVTPRGPVPQAELAPPAPRSSGALASETPEPGSGPGSIPVGCLVPDVRGKPLGIAIVALRIYECGPGKITQARSNSVPKGYVIAQSAAPGKQLRGGAKIRLTVSRGPRR